METVEKLKTASSELNSYDEDSLSEIIDLIINFLLNPKVS